MSCSCVKSHVGWQSDANSPNCLRGKSQISSSDSMPDLSMADMAFSVARRQFGLARNWNCERPKVVKLGRRILPSGMMTVAKQTRSAASNEANSPPPLSDARNIRHPCAVLACRVMYGRQHIALSSRTCGGRVEVKDLAESCFV